MDSTPTKTVTKVVAGVLITGLAYLVLAHFDLIPAALTRSSAVPTAFDLPTESSVPEVATSDVAVSGMPSTTPTRKCGNVIRLNEWAWNAQMGVHFANGGPVTTTGSLMEKHGVCLQIIRQDDTEKTKPQQLKFAQQLHDGATPDADTVAFTIIMGDGAAQYLAAQNKVLSKLGPDYVAEIVGAVGYSRGEDAFMGPVEWRDPHAMKGGLVAGVLRDGDWNIAQYYAAQNGIKNNPDDTTWDADALNWMATDDYLKAADLYITGKCADLAVVQDGHKTGKTVHKCVQGAVTWTPGDVNIAKKKGGVVKLLSTKENFYQMPAVVIGIKKFDTDHASQVKSMLSAIWEGGDQVKHYEAALRRGAQASYAIYKEESPGYWLKYYKGVVESDKTQQPIALGGSTVMNLADNLVLFGLAEGAGGIDNSIFKATYEG